MNIFYNLSVKYLLKSSGNVISMFTKVINQLESLNSKLEVHTQNHEQTIDSLMTNVNKMREQQNSNKLIIEKVKNIVS